MLKSKLKFWGKVKAEGPGELPTEVQSHLIAKYGLDAEYVGTLLCLTKDGWHLNKRVTLMRIFDPARVRFGGPSLRTYDSLINYRTAIVFEGHVRLDDMYLADRRTPTRSVGPVVTQRKSKDITKKT